MNIALRLPPWMFLGVFAGCFVRGPDQPPPVVVVADPGLPAGTVLPVTGPESTPAAGGPEPAPLAPIAQPPPLGWSSWSSFRLAVSEDAIKAQADVLAAKLAPSGFVYVNIDDGWFQGCDEHGRLKPDPL